MYYESIQFILEFIGTTAFAISGALLGVRRSMDVFGTLVLGLVTAVGGGMIRDLTLGITPPAAFTDYIGAFLGVFLVQVFQPILPFILALAGGAMLFVISDEIIPETHSNGYERQATYGIIIGFIVMMILDVTLG